MTEEERVDINSTIKKLSDYFEPKLNTTYERYVFNSCDQEIGERFDAYLNKLRKLIKTCRYSTLEDELLRDRIVMGTNKKEIWATLLSEPDLTLDRHAKQLPDLAIGQPIRVKCHPQNPNSDWTPGIVTSKAAPRSYMVQVDGQQYRRNRIHQRQQATFPDRAPTEPLNIRPRQLDTLPEQTPPIHSHTNMHITDT